MAIDTQKLRELEAKATAGPWHTKTECPGRCCWHVFKGLPMYGGEPLDGDDGADSPIVMGECSEEDAEFMAAIRNAAPALLDHIDAQTAEIARLREALRWTAATLQDATSSLELVFDEDLITLEGETKTVAQILDAADAALLAQHQGEKHVDASRHT